jgi:hypothetical protein
VRAHTSMHMLECVCVCDCVCEGEDDKQKYQQIESARLLQKKISERERKIHHSR